MWDLSMCTADEGPDACLEMMLAQEHWIRCWWHEWVLGGTLPNIIHIRLLCIAFVRSIPLASVRLVLHVQFIGIFLSK